MYEVGTLSGFRAQIRIEGIIAKEDKEKFRAGRMLDDGARDRLADALYDEIVRPALRPYGVMYYWGTVDDPCILQAYRLDRDELVLDPGNWGIVDAVKAVVVARPWRRHGCRFDIMQVKFGVWDPLIVTENYYMLTARDLADAALCSASFFKVTESAVVAAMRMRHVDRASRDELRELREQIREVQESVSRIGRELLEASAPKPEPDPVEEQLRRIESAIRLEATGTEASDKMVKGWAEKWKEEGVPDPEVARRPARLQAAVTAARGQR